MGVTNVKQVACGTDLIAIVDMRSDLYIVGRGNNQRVWLRNVHEATVVGPSTSEILVLTNDN